MYITPKSVESRGAIRRLRDHWEDQGRALLPQVLSLAVLCF